MTADGTAASLRIIFIGAHMEARAPFKRLMEAGEDVRGLVTLNADGLAKMSAAIDLTGLAHEAQIPTLRVRNVNQPDAVAWIRARSPDVLLVVGWTQLLSAELLRVPKIASLGFHASLLPKYRGRAPVNWAIINGENLTGNTMITLEPEADTGDIVAQRTIPITEEDDCRTVYEKVAVSEVEMLDEVLPMLHRGLLPRKQQNNSQATVMPKRRPEDGLIDWMRSTREIRNWVRALTEPYPGAFSILNGEKVWIWAVRADGVPADRQASQPGEVTLDSEGWPWVGTSDGQVRVVTIQRAGGPKVSGLAAGKTFLPSGSVFSGRGESPA